MIAKHTHLKGLILKSLIAHRSREYPGIFYGQHRLQMLQPAPPPGQAGRHAWKASIPPHGP
eukprot:2905672-Karenia_brevis.AAC.1